jgi:iron(III) transport system substrate-binding protein
MTSLVAKAKQEGSVTFYDASSNIDTSTAAGFQKKYGIKVNVEKLDQAGLEQRFAAEKSSGTNSDDVYFNAIDGFAQSALKNGWLINITSIKIPGFLGSYPASDITGPVALMQERPFGIAYNTKLVKTPPSASLQQLVQQYKGKILLNNPTDGDIYVAYLDTLAARYGSKFLTDLAKGSKLTSGGAAGMQQLVAGEGSIMLLVNKSLVAGAGTGAPVAYVQPADTYAPAFGVSIAAAAPHPAAACLLVSWMMSPAGQATISSASEVASPIYQANQLPQELWKSSWEAEGQPQARKEQLLKLLNIAG